MNGQLLEFTAFCFVFDMFWSYWKHIIRKLCDDFFDFTPTEIEHFIWEWPTCIAIRVLIIYVLEDKYRAIIHISWIYYC